MRLAPDTLKARAVAAEASGFDGLALMDHLAPPGALEQPMYEAFTLATWLAAATDRLRLGHLVLCDPFRHPAVLARQAVTLDHLSGGRFELGIGSGSTPAELATFGFPAAPAAQRLERLHETLELLTKFWTGEVVDHRGSFFSVEGARQLPAPLGRIPVVVGGTGAATMELVARYADWWNVPMHQLDRMARHAGAPAPPGSPCSCWSPWSPTKASGKRWSGRPAAGSGEWAKGVTWSAVPPSSDPAGGGSAGRRRGADLCLVHRLRPARDAVGFRPGGHRRLPVTAVTPGR